MNNLPVPVLIVDDDEQFATLLQQLLAAVPLGITFAPYWVNSAAAPRAAFDTNRFELVLLDNKLPGADGLDLLAELAQRPPRPPTRRDHAHRDRQRSHCRAGHETRRDGLPLQT